MMLYAILIVVFSALTMSLRHPLTTEIKRDLCKVMDYDKSGRVDENEVIDFLMAADFNENRIVTYEEFSNEIKKNSPGGVESELFTLFSPSKTEAIFILDLAPVLYIGVW
uniref:EF-hand domain-containing protein n=1 Tax=Arion vulgaris TaxID=1028688 RepID=A0A0B6Z6G9_9EUPU